MTRISFDWYDVDKSILYLQYGKGWTHQDVFHAFSETFETVESVNHTVDLLVEIADQNAPSSTVSFTSFLKTHISTNQRHTYFIGANTFLRILIRSAAAVVPAFERVTFCYNLDEALKCLYRDRESLAARVALALHEAD